MKQNEKKTLNIKKKEKKEINTIKPKTTLKKVKKIEKQNDTEEFEKRHYTFNLVEVVIIVMLTIIIVGISSGMLVFHNYEKLNDSNIVKDTELQEFEQTYNRILKDYVNKVEKKELITSAMEGMFNYLDDPNSSYLDEEQSDELNQKLNGTYDGVGVEITNTEKGIEINRVFNGTPAKKAGLKKGDIITKVNNTDLKDKSSTYVSNYIRYQINNKFTMEVSRDGISKKYFMKKEKIDYPVIYTENYDNVGYIYLTAFSQTSPKQFKEALKEMDAKKVNKLIIDLRYNTGGYLETAYKISDLFLPKGKIIYQLKTKNKITKYKALNKDSKNYDIVILINGKSASASEILTLALKNNMKNVTVVGEKSYGKGTVQQAKNLKDGAMVKYTTAKWLSPKGESINGTGIVPDYTIIYDEKTSNNEVDNQLQKALDVLK